jgi:citrate synthase
VARAELEALRQREARLEEVTRENVIAAIEQADTSGQWSAALDLLRERLVDPLTADNERLQAKGEQLEEALREVAEWVFPDSDPMVVREHARAALSREDSDD